jgi:signal transduction histidine kinase/ActR/RegA family two-component response regulator
MASAVVITAVASVHYYKLESFVEREVGAMGQALLAKLTRSVAPTVYEVNLDALFEGIESEFGNPYVKAILFQNDLLPEKPWVGLVREAEGLVDYTQELELEGYWRNEAPVVYDFLRTGDGDYLGKVVLLLDDGRIRKDLLRDLLLQVGEYFLIILVLILCVYIALNRKLRQPIEALTREVENIRNSIASGDVQFDASIRSLEALCTSRTIASRELESISQSIQSLLHAFHADRELLERAKSEAESANRAKEAFLAVISHEMRTPMNPILGLIDHLSEMPEAARFREHLDMMRLAGHQLLRHIDNVLTYSKLNYEQLTPNYNSIDLCHLCKTLLARYRRLAIEKKLDFSIELLEDEQPLPRAVVRSDVFLIETLMQNLISNAFQFTGKGSVAVTLAFKKLDGAGKGSFPMEITVRDTGCGIPDEVLPKLFQSFFQADQKVTRKHGGLGLGLAICAKAATLLGGKISVQSDPGHGSAFSVDLPVEIIELQRKGARPEDPASVILSNYAFSKHLLIVDDDAFNRTVLERLLKSFSLKMDLACNGEEAVEMSRNRDYDFVFMDISMPVMDGMQATIAIREIDRLRGRMTPIVAFTAHTEPEMRKRCVESGMNGYVVKPVNKVELELLLRMWMDPPCTTHSNQA